MDNIITYAEQTLDTFTARPFCDVDSLILSCVACSGPSILTACFR